MLTAFMQITRTRVDFREFSNGEWKSCGTIHKKKKKKDKKLSSARIYLVSF